MKIVDAVWEKRNLNKDTVEITIEKDDSIDYIEKVLSEQKANYQVVRVPDSFFECNEVLTKHGFVFVETMCRIKNDLKKLSMDMINERFKAQMHCEVMGEKDLENLYADFDNGIFTTDRIAIDPHFSIEIANNRYVGWIHDAMERGSDALNIFYKDEPAGFMVYKLNGDEADVLLGGMYSNFVTKGIGVAVYSKGYEYIKGRGIKKTFTAVSTNNFNSVRANMAIGYDIYQVDYVFVKHLTEKE